MFKYIIETMKPTSKIEAIELYIASQKNKLNNTEWLSSESKLSELKTLLSTEYDEILSHNPQILSRDNIATHTNSFGIFQMCDIERMWCMMLDNYVWIPKEYVLENIKKVNNVLVVHFENETTELKMVS